MTKRTQKPPSDFPHLREFARGYLHQDVVPEHGNPHQAALTYLSDLQQSERAALSAEAVRMRTTARHWTTEQLNQELAELGATWSFVAADEFIDILQTFERGH